MTKALIKALFVIHLVRILSATDRIREPSCNNDSLAASEPSRVGGRSVSGSRGGKRRFERMHSNSLWQADFKLTEDDRWMLTFLDDHSRFIPWARIEYDATTEFALRLFRKCGKKYGFPEQVLTDQGIQFYCAEKEGKEHGESTFTQTLKELGVQHIVASKRRPTTIGKVERFHRTYEEESWRYKTLGAFLQYYNYGRPHQALDYQFPAEVYFRDLKE
jgi:transposase InsO family protein